MHQGNSLRLKLWGVRGSTPTPVRANLGCGGNTACLEIRAGERIVILDAGSGMRALGQAIIEEFEGRAL